MGFFELFSVSLSGLYAVIPIYGLAIILLTLLVRVLLLPLTIKQTRSMREMQMIQPEVKKLQQKYKGNRQKMNEEMMALYKEHGINPLGGCLPLLLQMPVFIALFNVLRAPLAYMGYELSNGSWHLQEGLTGVMERVSQSDLAQSLATVPDKVNTFLGIIRLDCTATGSLPFGDGFDPPGVASACPQGWLEAIPYLLLIAIMGFSTMYSQKQMQAGRQTTSDDPAAQQQQLLMKIMPLMFVVFGFGFPAGLTLYWTTSNLWTIVQQWMMLRLVPHQDLATRKAVTAGKTDGKAGKGDGKQPGQAAKGSGTKGSNKGSGKSGNQTQAKDGGPKQTSGRQGGKKKKR